MKYLGKAAVAAVVVAGLTALGASGVAAQGKITLHGASQFDENHAFTRLMRKFEQLVQIYYTGDREIEFVMHPNSELGLEKDYFAYMSQGISVDYAVVVPAEIARDLPGAVDLIARREKVILDVCKSPDFDIEKLKQAMASSAEIH